jgi:hypothetical protein
MMARHLLGCPACTATSLVHIDGTSFYTTAVVDAELGVRAVVVCSPACFVCALLCCCRLLACWALLPACLLLHRR